MSKFRVGDKVRAVSASGGWGYVTKGDIGHVLSIDSSGELQVDFPAQKNWFCREHDLELVEPKSDQDQVKALLKGAKIGATMIGDALAKSQEAELTTRYGDRYKQYVDVATKTPLELKIEKCEAKLAKLKGQL